MDLDSEVVGVMNLLGPNELSGDSNYNTDGQEYGGTNKNICAPGTSVYSTAYGSDSSYGTMSGTSMATPYVAGVLALEFSTNPSLPPARRWTFSTTPRTTSPTWGRAGMTRPATVP